MTITDFFRMLIKLFALYALVSNVYSVVQSFGIVAYVDEPMIIIFVIFAWIIVITLFIFLLLYPDYFIDKLKLTRGFDNYQIDFNINQNILIKIIVFIFGGILFIDNLPPFLINTYRNFSANVNGIAGLENGPEWLLSGINIIVGYLLVTNYQWVVDFFNRKNKGGDNK